MELTPLAATCVNVLLAGRELNINGPIQVTLPLPTTTVKSGDAVPAWTFDMKIGKWVICYFASYSMPVGLGTWHCGSWNSDGTIP